ncbi:DUF2523 family protein [Aliivibrio fischeri]|uniref:DUF2523 family protein n=1 Tax=Aliivibrio fischeri TaxID=668 RepID=UPI0007C5932E|nr:DUF2523 family protein [Aliivibrio fischeri]MBP3140304.1 DUF2523 domain-containing protein [Aliivibrio fischeri]MBP3140313.1 DUF2523 domain-containing protein [Aliivibrio fischeri]MBP3154690.1 DUF2523 domain-containing protein [Aliivibrio fischeri]
MFEFFSYIGNSFNALLTYFTNVDSYFFEFFTWLQVWYIKMKFMTSIMFLKVSYAVATTLLDEIGFNSFFSDLFNLLPSEIRFYANLFRVPEGLGIYANCATTSLVLRLSR